jgi:hypothetical protein
MIEEKDDDLDGCGLEFDAHSDAETEKLLVPKGKELQSWTEEQEKTDGA